MKKKEKPLRGFNVITVVIYINNVPVVARSARNTAAIDKKTGKTIYDCDDGFKLLHNRENGAIELAQMMLKKVKQI